jgi:hypothetical protein
MKRLDLMEALKASLAREPNPERKIPYWVERVASQFRREQKGEIAAEEAIEHARAVLHHEKNERLHNGRKKPGAL